MRKWFGRILSIIGAVTVLVLVMKIIASPNPDVVSGKNPISHGSENAAPISAEQIDGAEKKMTACLQGLTEPQSGTEQQVQSVIRKDAILCGQEYISIMSTGDAKEGGIAMAIVISYRAMGCTYSDPGEADLSERMTSCVRPLSVAARGVSAVPGAIICPDLRTVQLMFNWYTAHWTDAMQDALTNGQAQLARGDSTSAPDLEQYGCALIPSGSPMLMEPQKLIPAVTAKKANGVLISGVTLPAMIMKPAPMSDAAPQHDPETVPQIK